MPLKINTAAFKSISMHSNALSILCSIAHPCVKKGQYEGRVIKGKQVVAHFKLNVDSQNTNPQVNIDLSSLVKGRKGPKVSVFTVKPSGFAMFYVSTGNGKYIVELRAENAEETRPIYSTKTLQKGDVYSAMLIRPGVYNVANSKMEKKASYTVEVPAGGQKAILSAQPLLVNCSKQGFSPNEGRLAVSKGLMFVIETPSVIGIDLHKDEKGMLIKDLPIERIKMPRWVRPLKPSF